LARLSFYTYMAEDDFSAHLWPTDASWLPLFYCSCERLSLGSEQQLAIFFPDLFPHEVASRRRTLHSTPFFVFHLSDKNPANIDRKLVLFFSSDPFFPSVDGVQLARELPLFHSPFPAEAPPLTLLLLLSLEAPQIFSLVHPLCPCSSARKHPVTFCRRGPPVFAHGRPASLAPSPGIEDGLIPFFSCEFIFTPPQTYFSPLASDVFIFPQRLGKTTTPEFFGGRCWSLPIASILSL